MEGRQVGRQGRHHRDRRRGGRGYDGAIAVDDDADTGWRSTTEIDASDLGDVAIYINLVFSLFPHKNFLVFARVRCA